MEKTGFESLPQEKSKSKINKNYTETIKIKKTYQTIVKTWDDKIFARRMKVCIPLKCIC